MPYKNEADRIAWILRKRQRRREEWFSTRPCSKCGTTDDLELHHSDPTMKVDHRVWGWGDERRAAELAKCVAMCTTCHDEHHTPRRSFCGTGTSYRRGCRCDLCREAQRLRKAKQRARLRDAA